MYVKWKLVSVCFMILLVLAQDSCTVCAECTSARKSFWAHPIVLIANVGQEESRLDPFGDSVSLGARYVHGLHQMYHGRGNRFGHTRMVLQGNVCQVEACFGPSGDSVSLRVR